MSAVALLMASSLGKHSLLLCIKKKVKKRAQEKLIKFQSHFSLYTKCI